MDKEIGGWVYKDVHSKSGKDIVFGKLDELLFKYYNVPEVGMLDQFKTNYKDQYIIKCPFCSAEGHTKEKLHISPNTPGVDDFDTGYCFVCGRTFIHISDKVDITYKTPNFLGPTINLPFEIKPMTDTLWTLKRYEKEFKPFSVSGVKYLEKRNPYLRDLWRPLGFKFYEDHVVMPFFAPSGELIYYQIRFTDATEKDSIRYFFPKTESKPPYIIQSDSANPKHLLVVEGIYDAIAAMIQSAGKYVVIGCMGSKLSDYQLDFIRNYYTPEKIIIWMDETGISKKIRERLLSVFNYAKFRIISSSGPDPEEILRHRIRTSQKIVWITPEYGDLQRKIFYPKFKGMF